MKMLSYRALGYLDPNELRRWRSDHPGNPLGRGYPMGSPLRREVFHEASQTWRGESHLMAWERISRWDPCAYCGRPFSGTADHVEPKSYPTRAFGGAYCWANISGACESCNNSKGSRSLLHFLAIRAIARPRRQDRLA